MRIMALGALFIAACAPSNDFPGDEVEVVTGFQPPVMTNANPPVRYPPNLFDQGVDGSVVLRLFVDESGTVDPESTAVAQSSGNLELDSAALSGVSRMRFAPATRDGMVVPATFLQPIHFRHSENAPVEVE
ncbi:MAG: energy transducer TonB [Gemmatimonadetes bacterium]|nr:energy transducer TonB [Gemmatimonadota bacterium]